MRILICGGRDYNDKHKVYETLRPYLEEHGNSLEIISGMARGADYLGWLFSHHHNLTCHKFQADWSSHGKAAGFIRNQQMIDEGKPNLVIAFPGGNGTADMVKRAKKHNIEVIEI